MLTCSKLQEMDKFLNLKSLSENLKNHLGFEVDQDQIP